MLTEVLVTSEIASAILAIILAYLFFKVYRMNRSLFLLGLPVGFSFFAASFIFLGLSLGLSGDGALSGAFMWIRLFTQAFACTFIVFAYCFSTRSQQATKLLFSSILLLSAVCFLSVLGALFVCPPFFVLPDFRVIEEAFIVINLLFFSYIVLFLFKKIESAKGSTSGLISAPVAFALLWLAQFCYLIWGIDNSLIAFVVGHIARLIALGLFLYVYYMASKGALS